MSEAVDTGISAAATPPPQVPYAGAEPPETVNEAASGATSGASKEPSSTGGGSGGNDRPGGNGAPVEPSGPAARTSAPVRATSPVEQPWRLLRRQAERRRYLTILTPRRVGKEKPRKPNPALGVPRTTHHLLRSPAELTRTATNFPDPEHVRQYLRHSCDITMSGGLSATLVYPLGVCALAEHYVVRRVGGSSVAAVAAAATAAAELGRGAPDATESDRGPLSVAPGFAGLSEAVGWFAGQDVAHQDAASLAAGRAPVDEGPEQWRLARMLQPAAATRSLFRLVAAVQRLRAAGPADRRTARRRVVLGLLVGFSGPSRAAAALAWVGALAAWLLVTAALVQSERTTLLVDAVVSLVLLVTAALAASGLTALAAALAVRDLVTRRAADAGFGLVPGVAVQWTSRRKRRGRAAARLDRLAGVPAPDGVPAFATWVTDRLDDLAGIPYERVETGDLFDSAGLLHDGGVPGEGAEARPALTFGDLWLGRVGPRTPEDEQRLRRAAADPEHRVVDLALTTTNLTQRRPYRLPLPVADELERRGLTRLLFCRSCLEAVLPLRVVVHLVKLSPSVERDHACPRHPDAMLHELPDPWDVPVALAVRMSMASPALLSAVPLCTVEADLDRRGRGSVRLHWFADGDLSAGMPVTAFDTLLPRWPTFGFHVRADDPAPAAASTGAGGEASGWGWAAGAEDVDVDDDPAGTDGGPDAGAPTGPPDGVDRGFALPAQDAVRRPAHWQPVATTSGFAQLVAETARSWGDASVADLPGYRGRIAHVLAGTQGVGDGAPVVPFVSQKAVLALAMRGFAAGEALRVRFTGPDGEVPGQTETDRYRWIRLRTALREYRGLSLSIGARLPLYSDLAAGYRVPAALSAWFPKGFEPGSRDPSWPEAAATVTHLRALSAGGVLDWDADLGAPPVDPELRLNPPV